LNPDTVGQIEYDHADMGISARRIHARRFASGAPPPPPPPPQDYRFRVIGETAATHPSDDGIDQSTIRTGGGPIGIVPAIPSSSRELHSVRIAGCVLSTAMQPESVLCTLPLDDPPLYLSTLLFVGLKADALVRKTMWQTVSLRARHQFCLLRWCSPLGWPSTSRGLSLRGGGGGGGGGGGTAPA